MWRRREEKGVLSDEISESEATSSEGESAKIKKKTTPRVKEGVTEMMELDLPFRAKLRTS